MPKEIAARMLNNGYRIGDVVEMVNMEAITGEYQKPEIKETDIGGVFSQAALEMMGIKED